MKNIMLLVLTILFISCTNKEKIQNEINYLEKRNLMLLDFTNDIYKTNVDLLIIKKNFRITSKDETIDKDIIEVNETIENNKKRSIIYDKEISLNNSKINELKKQLQ